MYLLILAQRLGFRHHVVDGEAELLHALGARGGGAEALDRHGVVGQHAFAAGGIMLFEQLHAGLGGEQDWKMC